MLARAFWTIISAIASHMSASEYCPPLTPSRSGQHVKVIKAGDVPELLRQLANAQPNTTLLLSAGVYRLAPNQSFEVNTPGMTIRGESGNRQAVVIEGGSNNLSIGADDVTVANL